MKALKEKDVTKVITGDGADEIFAGYNFLVKKDNSELKDELKRMKEIMHFTSQKIGNELGISIQMPFVDENIINAVETLPISLSSLDFILFLIFSSFDSPYETLSIKKVL